MSDTESDTASSVGDIIEEASEPDTTSFKCLFCDVDLSRIPDLLAHCNKDHSFDLESSIKNLGPDTDEITIIKLINYLRLEAKKGTEPKSLKITSESLSDDALLQPTVEDDALLFELGDLMPDSDSKAVDYDEFEASRDKKLQEDGEKVNLNIHEDRDAHYFESYKGNAIHKEMIEDRVRTEGYRDFIEKHAELFVGKTVLDVGCGTGILSLFCARAGAKKVFAVDNSDIAVRARQNVERNGYQDRVQVIQGKIEDFNTQRQVGKEKVDIIISEWMGYGLLFEGMLDSVLRARDLYLKEGGIMIPSHCTLRIAPVADEPWISESTGEKFWKDVYGFDFSAMIPGGVLNDREIGVFDVPPTALCGSSSTFYTLDIANITVKELDFTAHFESKLEKEVESLDAFAVWFDTFFVPPGSSSNQNVADINVNGWDKNGAPGLGFSTGPISTPTHWHQAVLLVGKEERAKGLKAGSTVKGSITYKKEKRDVRGIDVIIEWEATGASSGATGKVKRTMA